MKELIIPEREIIDKLIEKSPEFASFYKNERDKIITPITWIQTDSLPSGLNARSTFENGNEIIYLPLNSYNSLIIAHEMFHIIHRQYFHIPSIGSLGYNYRDLMTAINSSILDKLVNRDLLKYDFDICDYFENQLLSIKKSLKKYKKEPQNEYTRLLWSINFAANKTDYNFITSEYEYEDLSFFIWFKGKYPNVANESKMIEAALNNVDLNVIDSIRNYYKWIISTFNLSFFTIVNFR